MKYRISRVRYFIRQCELMAEIWKKVRDEDPSYLNHRAVIYYLVKRRQYLDVIEKFKRKRDCCLLY